MWMLCFWDFIIKHVKLNYEKVEETQFLKNFEKEGNFSSNKNDVSGCVKVDRLRCSSWTFWEMQMPLFWDFITNCVNLKLEKDEETQFLKNFELKTDYSSNKNDVSRRVKVNSLRCSSWTIWQMRMFLFWILLLNMLNSNVKKLKKHNFARILKGKQIFYQTKMT